MSTGFYSNGFDSYSLTDYENAVNSAANVAEETSTSIEKLANQINTQNMGYLSSASQAANAALQPFISAAQTAGIPGLESYISSGQTATNALMSVLGIGGTTSGTTSGGTSSSNIPATIPGTLQNMSSANQQAYNTLLSNNSTALNNIMTPAQATDYQSLLQANQQAQNSALAPFQQQIAAYNSDINTAQNLISTTSPSMWNALNSGAGGSTNSILTALGNLPNAPGNMSLANQVYGNAQSIPQQLQNDMLYYTQQIQNINQNDIAPINDAFTPGFNTSSIPQSQLSEYQPQSYGGIQITPQQQAQYQAYQNQLAANNTAISNFTSNLPAVANPAYTSSSSSSSSGQTGASGLAAMLNSPMIQQQLQFGTQGIQNQLAAEGLSGSGNAATALTNYAEGVAAPQINSYLSALEGLSSSGQQAASGLTSSGAQSASAVGSLQSALAQAQVSSNDTNLATQANAQLAASQAEQNALLTNAQMSMMGAMGQFGQFGTPGSSGELGQAAGILGGGGIGYSVIGGLLGWPI